MSPYRRVTGLFVVELLCVVPSAIEGQAGNPESKEEHPRTTLRIATLNIWNNSGPWSARRELIRRELAELRPDLIGLQHGGPRGGRGSQRVFRRHLGLRRLRRAGAAPSAGETASPRSRTCLDGYYDVALRDFGLYLGALALARLSATYDKRGKTSVRA